MPEVVLPDDMEQFLDPENPLLLPVGLSSKTIEPVFMDLGIRTVHMILGEQTDVSSFMRGIIPLMAKNGLEVIALDPGNTLNGIQDIRLVDHADLADVVEELYLETKNMYPLIMEEGKVFPMHRIIAIPAIGSALQALDPGGCESLRALLEKARPQWGWAFMFGSTVRKFSEMEHVDKDNEWIKASVSSRDGVFLGEGITNQTILWAQGDTALMRQKIQYPLGYLVREAEAERVLFISKD